MDADEWDVADNRPMVDQLNDAWQDLDQIGGLAGNKAYCGYLTLIRAKVILNNEKSARTDKLSKAAFPVLTKKYHKLLKRIEEKVSQIAET